MGASSLVTGCLIDERPLPERAYLRRKVEFGQDTLDLVPVECGHVFAAPAEQNLLQIPCPLSRVSSVQFTLRPDDGRSRLRGHPLTMIVGSGVHDVKIRPCVHLAKQVFQY